MTVLALGGYLPLSQLARIVAVVLAVALAAPAAVSLAVAGVDRRAAGRSGRGGVLVAAGAAVLMLLVAAGLYALVRR